MIINQSLPNATKNPVTYQDGDIAWVMFATILVVIMFPGLAFFYSGMTRSKNALQLIVVVFVVMAVMTVQWYLFGYSLTFSVTSGNGFIGNFDHVLFMDVHENANTITDKIPSLLFAGFQSMFAAITPAVALGSVAERARILPMIVFSLLWSTLVYDVMAYWTWNPNGWSVIMGGLDFAGGTPVHIASGAASLVYCIIVGKRRGDPEEFKAHNLTNVVLGTGLLWFGWLGFNSGCALAANMRAVTICVVTNLAAACGGVTWTLIDYIRERKLSALGFCSGAIAGLVCITPACGFVDTWSAAVIGVVGGLVCNVAMKIKEKLRFDDAVDVFAVHAVGGCTGNLLTGVFASKRIAALDGTIIEGGWVDGHWMQVVHQLTDTVAGFAYSFLVSFILLTVINRIPGLSLRADDETEKTGMDMAELGELAYYWANRRLSSALPQHHQGKAPADPMLASLSKLSVPGEQHKATMSKLSITIPEENTLDNKVERKCSDQKKPREIDAECHAQMTHVVKQLKSQQNSPESKSKNYYASYVNGDFRSTV